jgi:hypothetical protein
VRAIGPLPVAVRSSLTVGRVQPAHTPTKRLPFPAADYPVENFDGAECCRDIFRACERLLSEATRDLTCKGQELR